MIRALLLLAALLALALPASAASPPATECNGVSDIGSKGAAGCFHRDRRLSPRALAAVSFSILGRWKGTLHQRGLRPFVVTARIRGFDALSRNSVHYTGINCSGHWTYLTRTGGAYQFREVITSGKAGKCKGVGRVTLTRIDANHVHYGFRGGGIVSRGVLARRR